MPRRTQTITHLMQGHQNFYKHYYQEQAFFQPLVTAQHPKTLVIACCDSRVDPSILFDVDPGELFTLRVVANLVPEYSHDPMYYAINAALEFAVLNLNVEEIIILGHQNCAGIETLIKRDPDHPKWDFVEPWVTIAEPAIAPLSTKACQVNFSNHMAHCEKASLTHSLNNLRHYPWIQSRIRENRLQTHAWYFEIDSGQLLALDESDQRFKPVGLLSC